MVRLAALPLKGALRLSHNRRMRKVRRQLVAEDLTPTSIRCRIDEPNRATWDRALSDTEVARIEAIFLGHGISDVHFDSTEGAKVYVVQEDSWHEYGAVIGIWASLEEAKAVADEMAEAVHPIYSHPLEGYHVFELEIGSVRTQPHFVGGDAVYTAPGRKES